MKREENNYAFIDSQNLNLGIKEQGWSLDFKKFKIYLGEKYNIKKTYLFLGFMPENQSMYKKLQEYGYIINFKPVLMNAKGEVKGNVDADLVLQAMIDLKEYDKAVIITSDGDFYCLVDYLYKQGKLSKVISPNSDKCSILLKKTAKEKIIFMNNLRHKLEYKRKSTA